MTNNDTKVTALVSGVKGKGHWWLLALLVVVAGTGIGVLATLGPDGAMALLNKGSTWCRGVRDAAPLLTPFLAVAAMVLATASHLPVLTIMVLITSATWSFPIALAITITGIALGNMVSLLILRYVLKDWARKRWGSQIDTLAGKGGDLYLTLCTLRLVTVIPYPIVNAFMAATPISLLAFTLISAGVQIPNHILVVYAGTHVAGSERMTDLVDPLFIGALACLGLFALAARFVGKRRKKDRSTEAAA